MGISSMPSDNMMAITLYHMVLAVFLFKDCFLSVLRLFGFTVSVSRRMGPWYGYYRSPPELSTKEQFRRQFKALKFRSVPQVGERSSEDCRVCLVRFEQKCVVNKLECGHVFHRGCLEKWLDYCHVTCSLCRNYVLGTTMCSPVGTAPLGGT